MPVVRGTGQTERFGFGTVAPIMPTDHLEFLCRRLRRAQLTLVALGSDVRELAPAARTQYADAVATLERESSRLLERLQQLAENA